MWGDDLVFKVAAKMFAVVPLEPGPLVISFKTTAEEFAELIERPGFVPAPYLARAHWVAVERWNVLPRRELKLRLEQAYGLVVAKLPRKAQSALPSAGARPFESSPRTARGRRR